MKQNMTLRRILFLMGIVAVVLPMICFTVLFQIRAWKNLENYVYERMQLDLENRSMLVDLALEKYEIVLDDFCADEDLISLMELLRETAGPASEEQKNQEKRIHKKMVALCVRHDGVEGLSVLTAQGEPLFREEDAATAGRAPWTEAPKEDREEIYYRAVPENLDPEDKQEHLIQIVRRFTDEKGEEWLGTAVLSLNQKVLWQYQDLELDSDIVICEGNRVIAAENGFGIGEDISKISQDRRMILNLTNEKTGWTIWNFYSTEEFHKSAQADSVNWIFNVLVMVFLLLGIGWYMTKPIMDSINDVEEAMSQVEQGNFSTRVNKGRYLPREIVRIIDGYNTMAERAGELLMQVLVTMEDRKNAELSAMEAQIDPHFLYNTLDTINWKAIEKGDYEISSMVGALADILRYTIRNPGDTVSISQELYWLDQYIMFQKEKLAEALEVIVDVPQEIRECRIHKLLLQPFLENTIKHGFYQKEGPYQLKLRMNRADDQIHIMIEDNGKGIPPEKLEILNRKDGELTGHVGIANVKKRLSLYYGENADLYFESKEGSYTIVHLFVQVLNEKGE